jgi:hypothetical protein
MQGFYVGTDGKKYEVFGWNGPERPSEEATDFSSITGPFFSEAAAQTWVDQKIGIFGLESAPARVDRPRGF